MCDTDKEILKLEANLDLNQMSVYFQVHSDFVGAATRGAIAVIDGNVMAINPGEDAKSVFLQTAISKKYAIISADVFIGRCLQMAH